MSLLSNLAEFNPNAILIKVVGGIGMLLALWFVYQEFTEHYISIGRKEVQALWDADKVALKLAEAKALKKRVALNEAMYAEQQEINKGVIDELERKHKKQTADYLLTIDYLKSHGGLRFPSKDGICSPRPASETSAQGTTGSNETSYTRLPEKIENDLLELANDADIVTIQLGACQGWIKANGFSTKSPEGK